MFKLSPSSLGLVKKKRGNRNAFILKRDKNSIQVPGVTLLGGYVRLLCNN